MKFQQIVLYANSLVALACLLSIASSSATAQQFKRVGILAADNVEQSGLLDLITAKLSQEADLELVERQQLDLATKEIELSQAFGAEGLATRLQIGETISADALLFLTLEKAAGKTLLRVIISDCRYGARLHDESFLFSADKLETHAGDCTRILLETRAHFADGIRYLFGVTNFLSKNLTHEHDHLQAGFAQLVSNSLGLAPGVAVIEFEESQAIAAELSRRSEDVKRSLVPLVVGGEFEITSEEGDAEPLVQLTVRLTDGTKLRETFERTGITMEAVTNLLSQEVPQRILDLSDEKSAKLFSQGALVTKLGERATAFSQRGAWKQATELREASLLLEPKDHEQRLELIADYRHWHREQHAADIRSWETYAQSYRRAKNYPERFGKDLESEKTLLAKIYADRLSRIRRIAEMIEFVCRFKAVNAYEGHLLMEFGYKDLNMFAFPGEAESPEFQRTIHNFFWSTYPFLPKTSVERGERLTRYCVVRGSQHYAVAAEAESQRVALNSSSVRWVGGAIDFIFRTMPLRVRVVEDDQHRLLRKYETDDSRTLDDFLRFVEEVVPQNYPSDRLVGVLLGDRSNSTLNNVMDLIHSKRFKPEEFRSVFEKLETNDKPLIKLYGSCGQLTLDMYATPNSKPDPSVVSQLNETELALSNILRDAPGGQKQHGFGRYFALVRRDTVERLSTKKRYSLPANMIPPPDPNSRLCFSRVEGVIPDWEHAIRCTDSLDVFWSREHLSVMREKGKVRKLFEAGVNERSLPDSILSVSWDGELIWFASRFSGVRAVTSDGKVIVHFDQSNGLPEYEVPRSLDHYPIVLLAVSKNRCIAASKHGEQGRNWIAMIERADGGAASDFRINVIHKSTKLSGDVEDGIDEIFDYCWTLKYIDAKDNVAYAFFGRRERFGEQRSGRTPLAINLSTLEASVLPVKFRSTQGARYVQSGKSVFLTEIDGVSAYAASDGWRTKTLIAADRNLPGTFQPMSRTTLLEHDGYLYNPGILWHRIDPKSDNVEGLNEIHISKQFRFGRHSLENYYGVSAHYGLIAWHNEWGLYKVEVDVEPSRRQDLAVQYSYVPAEKRDAHHQAVLEIRRLGGSVDAEFDRASIVFSSEIHPSWRTIVYLPKDWKGGDEGLKHLRDLHAMRRLYLVQASITNGGTQIINELSELEVLWLVETQVTDEGLSNLTELTSLNDLRLEGSVNGDEFSSAGLRDFPCFEKVHSLRLYGAGFDDKSINTLKGWPELRSLTLTDTAITTQALEEIKKAKGRFFRHEFRPCSGNCTHLECHPERNR